MIGSGPFKFVKEEFEPGNKDRVRQEQQATYRAASRWASGGKIVKVDRAEWLVGRMPRPKPRRCRPGKTTGRKTHRLICASVSP
jgi:hypothetical protein